MGFFYLQLTSPFKPMEARASIGGDRKTAYWAQWLRKDIRIIDDLFENGNFLSYIRFKENFNLEGRGHFWKYLQIRHCIKEVVPVGRDRSPIECYLQLPKMHHKASRWYEMCPWTNNNGCSNLKMIWEKDLSCTLMKKHEKGFFPTLKNT